MIYVEFLQKGISLVDAGISTTQKNSISEDGYYGIKQTSERLFDFASALAGDDVEKMEKMQTAMQKGISTATGAWQRPSRTSATRGEHWMLQIRSLRIIISPKDKHNKDTKAENRLSERGLFNTKEGKKIPEKEA